MTILTQQKGIDSDLCETGVCQGHFNGWGLSNSVASVHKFWYKIWISMQGLCRYWNIWYNELSIGIFRIVMLDNLIGDCKSLALITIITCEII